jgi:hypothetical protein
MCGVRLEQPLTRACGKAGSWGRSSMEGKSEQNKCLTISGHGNKVLGVESELRGHETGRVTVWSGSKSLVFRPRITSL